MCEIDKVIKYMLCILQFYQNSVEKSIIQEARNLALLLPSIVA